MTQIDQSSSLIGGEVAYEYDDKRPYRNKPHPTANAFFRHFDKLLSIPDSNENGKKLSQSDENQRIRKSSQMTASDRIVSQLGWRNRYAQLEYYPVTVNNITFTVRQLQPNDNDNFDGPDFGKNANNCGTGATIWPASLVLVKYLEKMGKSKLENKTVLDLGSGTAITSMAAALLGAKLVLCTDGNSAVVNLAISNVQHFCNKKHSKDEVLKVREYLWGDGDDKILEENSFNPYDIILVSDCVLPKLFPMDTLVDSIKTMSGPHSVTYLSYEDRYYPEYNAKERFMELANEKGLEVRIVRKEEMDETYQCSDIEIWEVSWK
mmetsp:Transcript_6729/g.7733  ORF Transcript_6729/g.7733 Transcript_6729/m.7733 type:complete len:321 (-) Transcript_6729:70-1032(-)